MQLFDFDRLLWLFIGAVVCALVARVTKLVDEANEERRKSEEHRKDQQKQRAEQDELQNAASRYLLKDRMLQACDYWMAQGFCPTENREVLADMFNIYSKLGGNSFMHDKISSVMALPVRARLESKEQK